MTQTPQGLAFSVDGAAPNPLQWVEAWTFRRNGPLLTFRRGGNSLKILLKGAWSCYGEQANPKRTAKATAKPRKR